MKEPEMKIKESHLSQLTGYKVLLAFTLLYFIAFGLLMVHTSGQPDQGPHAYFSRKFSETWRIPEDDPNIQYLIKGQPYLYYWINGAVYKILRFLLPSVNIVPGLLWRLISLFYATLTVFFTYQLGKKVTGNPYYGILAAFFLSNTLMFVFVSGGISYDNLMNLAAIASIYHLVMVYKKDDYVRHTALVGFWVIIGSLAKDQFLLLTLIIFLAWLFFTLRNFKSLSFKFCKANVVLSVLFVVFLGLFLGLYGVNLVRYGRITASCSQIKAIASCRTYDYRYEHYQPFNLQWMWFVRDHLTDPIKYAMKFWIYKMAESVWGILSHQTFVPTLSISLHLTLLIWAIFNFFLHWKPRDRIATLLLMILISYVGFVFFWNYKNEVEFNFQHYVVTGRYLSPILSILAVFMSYAFMKIRSALAKRFTVAIAILIYFMGGLGMFISRYANVFSHWRLYFN
jgi:hypothetical protein